MSQPVDIRPNDLAIVQAILRDALPHDANVWVFGSRAKWTTKDASDLDLAIDAGRPMTRKETSVLEDAFEESDLPYKVDVVDMQRVSESFKAIIERDKVALPMVQSQQEKSAMGEWQTVTFERLLAEPVRNGIYKPKEFHGSGTKIVNMGELFGHPRLRDVPMKRLSLNASEAQRFDLQSGDLLFARRSLVAEGAGKCSVVLEVNEPTTFESSIIRARPDKQKADSLFLYYFFNSPTGFYLLDTIRRQVAVAGITGSDLSKLVVPVPKLTDQQAISSLLGALDDKIDLNRQMNETLEATARLFFKDWFIDFGPTRAKAEGRPPYLAPELWALFPDALDDDDKPVGWTEKPLSSLIELIGGGTPKTSVAEYWNGSIPWFSVVDAPAPSDTFVIKTEKTITPSGLEGSSTRLIPRNATIITARGTVGKLALVGVEMAMNQSCYAITGKAGWSNYFIHFILKNAVQTLQANTHGSVFDTITRATFDAVSSCCPTQNIAIAFDETIRELMEQIRSNLFEHETLAQTRDFLLPKLMSGEIRLRDAEKLVEQVA